MVTVTAHGERRRIQNPANPSQLTDVQLVTFTETGRGGANASMAESSDVLSKFLGQETGLPVSRIHTHPVLLEAIPALPVGRELPFFVNRKLFSTPQITQQVDVAPRMVDGKPTYFITSLADKALEDEDLRLTQSELIQINPDAFVHAQVGAANVTRIDEMINSAILESARI